MKAAVIAQFGVEPELRSALESMVQPGETLSPTAAADLERLFEILLDRSATTEGFGITPPV